MEGDDKLRGNAGNDVLVGGSGDDTLHGGEGNDISLGGEGDDTHHLTHGLDRAYGGNGDDILISYDGGDELSGGLAGTTGNQFVVRNTTLNGKTIVKDFWIDERNNITTTAIGCDNEAVFTFEELSACLESEPPETDPELQITVEECIASVYFTTQPGNGT